MAVQELSFMAYPHEICGIIERRQTQFRRIVATHLPEYATCPFGQVGTRLWVQEPWMIYSTIGSEIAYRADSEIISYPNAPKEFITTPKFYKKWQLSSKMPRWASRLLLEIVNIKVERLNNISDEDARCEGCTCRSDLAWGHGGVGEEMARWAVANGHRFAFKECWESIYGPDSWQLNQFVWAVSFKKINQ